ncbi:ecotin putative (LiISP1) [Leptomonas pyrrhocoris]|uniref:Ecotin putative (LiISP1) n=1 Tax=Leptomonas pyrrhocoris TaxID=157538 RepID=A0A0N0DQP5_LEPPY|nr:ecotin putative (LiISP1) [Leptomonas pyrrhocoris]KPA73311.1 ecotin putative (LiISP1) [Leptomonas pyrrhocoris]|eukprot:XP_015651750.1 ecotin putative (LiISP1) [Leptomonas pyrrhocoris]
MSYCKIAALYPQAPRGEKRIIFALDPLGEEVEQQQFMLQLIPARVMKVSKTDAGNVLVLQGKIEQHTVEGGDVPYFHVELAREYASTRRDVADDDDGVKVRQLVPMTQPPMFPYSSVYPVVVYLPEDVELHYSVWYGEEPMQAGSE